MGNESSLCWNQRYQINSYISFTFVQGKRCNAGIKGKIREELWLKIKGIIWEYSLSTIRICLRQNAPSRVWPFCDLLSTSTRAGLTITRWNSTEVILQTPQKNYTVSDYQELFTDAGFPTGYQIRQDGTTSSTDWWLFTLRSCAFMEPMCPQLTSCSMRSRRIYRMECRKQ